MIEIESSGEAQSIHAPLLRLSFRKAGDRWTHALGLRPDPGGTLAEAVEWDTAAAAADPARVLSPVYQELTIVRDGDDVLALLVGRAGPHHFSAAFRVRADVAEDESPRCRIEVDVADRCRGGSFALTCTYRVRAPVPGILLGTHPQTAVWEPDLPGLHDVALQVTPDGAPPAALVTEPSPDPTGAWPVHIVADPGPDPNTQRCQYTWLHTRRS